MKRESRPGKRLPNYYSVSAREVSRRSGRRDREHALDRMIVAAVHRRERAAAGKGYEFRIPEGLRP
jgi:hypothetical protein